MPLRIEPRRPEADPPLYGMDGFSSCAPWGWGSGGSGVTVAIIGEGVDVNHPDLKGHVIETTAPDETGTGTHLAGVILGVPKTLTVIE